MRKFLKKEEYENLRGHNIYCYNTHNSSDTRESRDYEDAAFFMALWNAIHNQPVKRIINQGELKCDTSGRLLTPNSMETSAAAQVAKIPVIKALSVTNADELIQANKKQPPLDEMTILEISDVNRTSVIRNPWARIK